MPGKKQRERPVVPDEDAQRAKEAFMLSRQCMRFGRHRWPGVAQPGVNRRCMVCNAPEFGK